MSIDLNIQENVPLAPLTTLKIGGNARYFVRAATEQEIVSAFNFSDKNEIPLFILGGGSNVLISDDGFDGLVLQVAIKGVLVATIGGDHSDVTAGAGEDWDRFVEYCVERNFQGIECLSGIPGFVGGTPVQNVGAYGQEVSESILTVRCFDRRTKAIVELANSDCKFAYRSSIFNTIEKERFIVISVKYRLKIKGEPKIVYADLRDHFGSSAPGLESTRDAVLKIRAAKSMVIDEQDINSQSVGSFFKNPILSLADFEAVSKLALMQTLIETIDGIPRYRIDDDNVKIPAAWLIEKSGFYKGFKMNNAGLSKNHTLAIVNFGNAKASDVLDLKEEIQRKVNETFGIDLIPEPIFIGFDR